MSSAQLKLPLEDEDVKPLKIGRRIKVKELMTRQQDFEILNMTKHFVEDVDLDESVDVDILFKSCIRIRNDVDRKQVNCFIAYEDDKAVGFLVGVATPAFHRQGIVAEQKLCYVIPNRRGSFAAVRLLQAFERWARLQGATQIFTGTANRRYAEKTSKFFEQLGYARVGALHVKEI